jgi:hypothetical protein
VAELETVDQGVDGMIMPSDDVYNHHKSTSFIAGQRFNNLTGQMDPKTSQTSYGSGVARTVDSSDTIQLGDNEADSFVLKDFGISEIMQDSLTLLHTKKGLSGVLGLQHMANRSLGTSMFAQMREANLMQSFGYCANPGNESTGTMIWGDYSHEGTPINIIGQMHWAIPFSMFQVKGWTPPATTAAPKAAPVGGMTVLVEEENGLLQGKMLESQLPTAQIPAASAAQIPAAPAAQLPAAQNPASEDGVLCRDGKCVAILDTGSNIIAGPKEAVAMLTKQIGLKPDCSNLASLKPITVMLGGREFTIAPEGYVMKVPFPKGLAGILGKAMGSASGKAMPSFTEAGLNASLLDEKARQESKSYSTWREVLEDFRDKRGIDLTHQLRDEVTPSASNTPITISSGTPAVVSNPSTATNPTSKAGETAAKGVPFTVPDSMCMLALVSMDKQTQHGPLYIFGHPLSKSNYIRWSYPQGAAQPQVFLQPLAECETCKHAQTSLAATLKATPVAGQANTPAASGAPPAPPATPFLNPSTEGAKSVVSAVASAAPAKTLLQASDSERVMRTMREKQEPAAEEVQDMLQSEGPPVVHLDDISFPHWALELETL